MSRCHIIAVCNQSGLHWGNGCGRLAGVLQGSDPHGWFVRGLSPGPPAPSWLSGRGGQPSLCPWQGKARTTVLPGFGSLVGQLCALTQTNRHWWGPQSRLWLKTIRQEKAVALTLLPEMNTSSLKWEIAQEASNICFLAHSQTALSNRDRMPATHTIYNFIQSTVKKKKYKTVGKINFNNIFHLKYVNTTLI